MTQAAPIQTAKAAPVAAKAPAKAQARGGAAPFGAGQASRLVLGAPGDRFERQADAAARHVVGGHAGLPMLSPLPAGELAQRACSACKAEEDRLKPRIQRKCGCGAGPGEPCACSHCAHERKKDEEHPELRVDRDAKCDCHAGADAIRAVEDVISRPGRPLPEGVRQEMEAGFGRDLSSVRIHDGPGAAVSADGIGAHAYTVGNHIAFNRGKFQPQSRDGKLLLAHELAHTVQQTAGPAARPVGSNAISQPTDHHEAEARQAARAAVNGTAMPALSPGAAPISRDAGDDAASLFGSAVDYVERRAGAALDYAEDKAGAVVNIAEDVLDAAWGKARQIARALGGDVWFDGTALIIDVPQFHPCPETEFSFNLSDIGLAPSLSFPIAEVPFYTVGIVTLLGTLSIEVALDPGIGFRLAGCSFGPGRIRLDPLSGRASVSGAFSAAGTIMYSLGADLGLNAGLQALIIVPAEPPIPLMVPLAGVTLGGDMMMMLQAGGTVSGVFSASTSLHGTSASVSMTGDLGGSVDLAYGLFGSIDILGFTLCRLGWPLDSIHREVAARLTLDASASLSTSGLSFSLDARAAPLATNPLDDLGFAFDQSRLEDDCFLCDLLKTARLLPGDFGYNWASLEPSLPRLAGPLSGIYQRNPGLASGALCRGTCGVDCPSSPSCTDPYDLTVCEDMGDHHVWHTYVNYATCGTHQGCRDHDACYDYAASMPIWGFGGAMTGPMYRACDLEAMCNYGLKNGATWAFGGGPNDGDLAYADELVTTPGCLGSCPQNVAAEGEAETMKTCLPDHQIWEGMEVGDTWEVDFGSTRLFQGFVEIPWIVGVHYGIDASARADAAASAMLGPVNLENACLIYDPATMTYTGTADLVLYLSGGAVASITGRLDGWLADFLCVLRVLNLGGWVNAGISAQLLSDSRFGVELYCANGDLEVIPTMTATFGVKAAAELSAGFDIALLGFTVHEDDWKVIKPLLDKRWTFEFLINPFRVGEMPDIDLISSGLDVFATLLDLFDEAAPAQADYRQSHNPIAGRGILFPCLGDGDDDNEAQDCQKATGKDGDRLLTAAERAPAYGPVSNLSIPGGDSAGVASWMEARYLTDSHPEGSETNDSVQRGIYRRVGLPTGSCVGKGYKQSQVYIKGHLLSRWLGGPAEERNLFPIIEQANRNHEKQVEQSGLRVVPRVNADNELIYYKVSVGNVSAPSEIMTSAGNPTGLFEIGATLNCEVADYQLCPGDRLQINTPQTVNIRSEFIFHPSGGNAFDTIMKPCSR